MDARTLGKQSLASLAAVALLAGCAAGATVAPSSSSTGAPLATAVLTTGSPGIAGHWDLVSISDSVFGSGDENHLEAVDAYAAGIERDLGVDVTIHGYWLGGYTSDQLLDLIQSDEVLRATLSSADVIVFEVPIGEVRSECPWDNVEWHALPGTPAEWRTCTARTAARNTANAGRIMDAIVALRSPADALILASNLWELGYRANVAQGIEPQMHDMFTAANAAVAAAAASHGIPTADARTAFMGPDGGTDPVATGDLLGDMIHLTAQGAAKLAALWRGLGYEKGRTVVSPPAESPVPVPSP
jgi:lysophospholipase L1-like esterase